MLHIILWILKMIGIILAAILGILVLLLCVVLFVPLRYQIDASCAGTPETLLLHARFHWFFHLIRGEFNVSGRKVTWNAYLAWKNVADLLKGSPDPEEDVPPEAEPEEVSLKKEVQEESIQPDSSTKELPPEPSEPAERKQPEPEKGRAVQPKESPSSTGQDSRRKVSFWERITRKIRTVFQKIKYTFRKICDTIKMLARKKERLVKFIEYEVHRRAFGIVKKELFALLKNLRPKEVKITARFGFEDPSLTGYLLAGLSMLYPFCGDTMDITPDFEEQVLEGTAHIKGKIRVIHFVSAGFRIIARKDVRLTVKHIRNYKW